MSKELDELRREYAENEAKLRQYQHRAKRLEQRKQYYEKGERQKRAHRLITRGAAVESVAPEVRPLSEQGFYRHPFSSLRSGVTRPFWFWRVFRPRRGHLRQNRSRSRRAWPRCGRSDHFEHMLVSGLVALRTVAALGWALLRVAGFASAWLRQTDDTVGVVLHGTCQKIHRCCAIHRVPAIIQVITANVGSCTNRSLGSNT